MSAPLTNEPDFLDLDVPARLRAAPALEPPYDDDTPPPAAVGAPAALRVIPGLSGVTELPFERIRGRLQLAGRRISDDDPFFAPQPTPRTALTDPAQHGARILRAVFEILGRRRPLNQLLPWTSEDVYEEVTAWVYRAMRADPSPPSPPDSVRSVRVSEPADGVAELTAVVHLQGRVRAVVLRLEGVDGRWRCTLLRLI
jgi:hypothetical protein